MRLEVVIVGRDRRDPLVQAALDYEARIQRHVPLTVTELKEVPLDRATPVGQVQRKEAERIDRAISPGAHRIALDERGILLSSHEVADRMRGWMKDDLRVAFVVGGPSGLDPDLRAAAHERWALSRMTLPHRLARLVLLEQLYRAGTILRGEPYHK